PRLEVVEIGEAVLRRVGRGVALLVFGTLLAEALKAAEELDATVLDMRFVKPLDEEGVLALAESHDLLVTIEENTLQGGAGSAVNELLAAQGRPVELLNLGLPDCFLGFGRAADMLAEVGLDRHGIRSAVQARRAQR